MCITLDDLYFIIVLSTMLFQLLPPQILTNVQMKMLGVIICVLMNMVPITVSVVMATHLDQMIILVSVRG